MILMGTILDIADNSGALQARCIKVVRGDCASIGDTVMISVRKAVPRSKVKKGKVYRALVVRTRKKLARGDGTYVSFAKNAVVLVSPQNDPLGTRVFGAIPRELRYKSAKVISLAPEVV